MPQTQTETATPAPAAAAPTTAAKPVKTEDPKLLKKIHILKTENTKRKGTTAFKKFAIYKEGMTVKEFRRIAKKDPALRTRLSLKWDIDHKLIELVD